MPLPTLDDIVLPLLEILGDGMEWRVRDASRQLEAKFGLTKEDLREAVSGGMQKFLNRVWWGSSHLFKAGLAERPSRGFLRITPAGRGVLAKHPARLDARTLAELSEEFRNFFYGIADEERPPAAAATREPVAVSPIEQIEQGVSLLHKELREEILARVLECTPEFFERLVVKVLVAMGYGGNIKDAGQAVGRSGDGGIDGIIKEDRLGLDRIYVQAKRWKENVGSPEVLGFVGALSARHARKGGFITTSDFTASAREAARNLATAVVLINGQHLAELMLEHGVGVSLEHEFKVLRLDQDFFSDGV